MRFQAYIGGVLDSRQLGRRLLHPQFRNHGSRVRNVAKWIQRFQFLAERSVLQRVYFLVRAQDLIKLGFEFFDWQYLFEASESVHVRIFGGCSLAHEVLPALVVMRQEENLARGRDQQSRVRIGPASQVIEIRLLIDTEYFVAALRARGQQHHAIQRFPQIRPARSILIQRHVSRDEWSEQEGQGEKSAHMESLPVSGLEVSPCFTRGATMPGSYRVRARVLCCVVPCSCPRFTRTSYRVCAVAL
jgi:hypothetical protein